MTPKEKAKDFFDLYFYMKWQSYSHRKTSIKSMTKFAAKQCALLAVEKLLNALDAFGYQGAMYDDFETGRKVYTDEIDPCKYWNEVKQEINKL